MTFRPPFFVPRPNDDPDWYPRQHQNNNFALLNSVNPRPIHRMPWRYFDTDDEPVWYSRPYPSFITLLTKPSLPGIAAVCRFEQDDEPVWSAREKPNNFALLNSVNPRPIHAMPWRHFDTDDEPSWYGREKPNNFGLLNSTNPLPIRHMPWQYKQDDEPFWVGRQVSVNPGSFPSTKPGIPVKYRFFDTDDEPFWQGQPVKSTQPLLSTINPLPIRYMKWRFHQDDEPVWQGRPVAINANVVNPSAPVKWRFFDTDDDPFWEGKPVKSTQPMLVVGKPRLTGVPAKYRFEADDEAFWQGKPNPPFTDILVAETVSLPVKWRFPVDDEAFWQGRPVITNILTFPVNKPPIIPPAWRPYDDPSNWQRSIYRNVTLTTSTVPAIYNVSWKHYDDASNWQWKQPYTLALFPTPLPPSGLHITDTTHLQLPINAVLMGQQDYEEGPTEIENNDPNYRIKVKVSFGGGGKLSSSDPGFTTKTSKKGYD